MDVTVTLPDQFVERLIPAGKDASRVLLERLVDGACDDGRIDAEEANEILGRPIEADPDAGSSEDHLTDAVFERYLNGKLPEWIDDPEQVRLHEAAAKFIGCSSDSSLTESTEVSHAMKDSLMDRYKRTQRGR